ncbi:transcriptional regulator STERILE APETALA [Castanea sativa]|uniref:transcriptional regulator STERILE APETALA n=1 Tax=Castanea sativa TaxID=21020 RepID=UPI003F65412F
MSSSSSSSSEDGNGNGNGGGSTIARRGGDFEGPSTSRQRAVNEVWPEHFVEALAAQVAIDASHSIGRLAAAPALANVFQVCSTWRAVSRWDALWHRLTRSIWGRAQLLHDTWHDEFVYWHRTAQNFHTGRSAHGTLAFDDVDNQDGYTCRCMTMSDRHLACGFADGAVRVFDLAMHNHVVTLRPHEGNHLGQFARAVSGIVINGATLAFATLDGDIHVAMIIGGGGVIRRAHEGNVVNDGALVDFTGCGSGRWWVGLYAGAPNRAFHIWDSVTEELVYVNGSLTNPESVMGWHLLINENQYVGRVRVVTTIISEEEEDHQLAVACTSSRLIVFDLRNPAVTLFEEESNRGFIVTSVDVSNDARYIRVDNRGDARVCRLGTLEEVCRFNIYGGAGGGRSGSQRRVMVMGCMNLGYALMCVGGMIRVWEVLHGGYLYHFRERIGEVNAVVANERYVAAASSDRRIHLWDFGADQ